MYLSRSISVCLVTGTAWIRRSWIRRVRERRRRGKRRCAGWQHFCTWAFAVRLRIWRSVNLPILRGLGSGRQFQELAGPKEKEKKKKKEKKEAHHRAINRIYDVTGLREMGSEKEQARKNKRPEIALSQRPQNQPQSPANSASTRVPRHPRTLLFAPNPFATLGQAQH